MSREQFCKRDPIGILKTLAITSLWIPSDAVGHFCSLSPCHRPNV